MKKNGFYIVFLGLFLVLCLSLSAGILFAGPAQPGANEQLQKTPVWKEQDGTVNDGFLAEAAAWVNDHFFLRQTFISADHKLTNALLFFSG